MQRSILIVMSFILVSPRADDRVVALGMENNTSTSSKMGENHEMNRSNNKIIEVEVGLILNNEKRISEMGYECLQMGLLDFYATNAHYKTRVVLHPRIAKSDVVSSASAALYLIKNVGVKAMIGPLTSTQTEFVINLGTKAQVPIISYSATSPFLSSIGSPYFFRVAENDFLQVNAIGALIQAFGWKEVVPIYENSECGQGIMHHLVNTLQGIDTRIPYQSVVSREATDEQILQELYKMKTMSTRVFIVHLWPTIGARMFLLAKRAGMLSQGYVWILTNGMSNLLESFDHVMLDSMQGVLGVRTYVPKTKELERFVAKWSSMKYKSDHPNVAYKLNVYGLWAYDASIALAKAIEQLVHDGDLGFLKVKTSSNSTDLNDIGVSKIGPKLVQAISRTRFKGLGGDFRLKEGELQSSTFEIVNIVGNGWKKIGFWTPQNGLTRDLNVGGGFKGEYSTSKVDLGAIILPGDSLTIPKGWVIPTSGKKLRVGVPVKPGFDEFVKVSTDSRTNVTKFSGYCLDVFNAAMMKLPYYVPFEYIPFAKDDGTIFGSYDDLVYQVYIGKYDMVAGDITITANRSQYVDFTLPYSESGVTMVTPNREVKTKKAWMFLKPLTWDLWVTTFCFFVFIAFVIWVLEHRINDNFRGPPSYQAGTTLYHSFSVMVFAQSENVFNNLARIVMVIWIFVVFILTQSYTASLTSMLTVQQLKPIVHDVNELIKRGDYVGYQQGSFVYGLLKHIGFQESKLKPYKDCIELDELLSKGSKNGGIAAVFDELPYMTLFVARHCGKYNMAKLYYKTSGFGFVFPKGSLLVSDVSRAILSILEGEKMAKIEDEWTTKEEECGGSSKIVSYDSLGLESFWGLFLIAGVVAFVALIVFLLQFLCRYRNIWMNSDNTIRRRLQLLKEKFDNKDESSHKFKKNQQNPERSLVCHCGKESITISPLSCLDDGDRSSNFSSNRTSPSPSYTYNCTQEISPSPSYTYNCTQEIK